MGCDEFQYDEIWRMDGPLSPRCVKSMASRNCCFPADAMVSVETPARLP